MDPTATLLLIGFAAAVAILFLIALRWLHSPIRRIDRHLEQHRTGQIPLVPERTDWDFEIIPDSEGFTIVPLSNPVESPIYLKWNSIITATAFKRDLLSTDQVCIKFRMTDDSEIEVHEEMKGWVELCDALPSHLSGTPAWTDWFMKITTPAFELCETPLFRRSIVHASKEPPQR